MYGSFCNMWVWILLFGAAVSAPADEFRRFISEGELTLNDESHIMQIVPSGYSPQKVKKNEGFQLPDFIDKNSPYYNKFEEIAREGYAMKGLTFNLYDDNMRNTAISLFRILQSMNPQDLEKIEVWAKQNINIDLFDYALRLTAIYGNKEYHKEFEPPFIFKPNYYVNSETIVKGLRLKLNSGRFHAQEARTNQFNVSEDFAILSINTNYSGWNLRRGLCEEKTNYFREDVGLNSYYYGIHLLHPFWMSSDELDNISPRHAEHYYYLHRQLLARYFLEKEHLKQGNITIKECESDYYPYLVYDNGLAFPNRPSFVKDRDEARIVVQSIDIAIKECISRRLIMLDNGTFVKITEDNYLQLLPKLLRANLDSVRPAKIIRTLYGYGGGLPSDGYTPAPSVLHHPQTSLRDRAYWYMIERALNYSLEFINTLKPYNITEYDNDKFRIVEEEIDNITTYFDYYEFSINKALGDYDYIYNTMLPRTISARQRRLKHMPFTFKFVVRSYSEKKVVIRFFLGPPCTNMTCWSLFDRFFELDSYKSIIKMGANLIVWSSENSSRLSFDDHYNREHHDSAKQYNVFKFPQRLVIPKGLEEGLNLTLFISITPYDESTQTEGFSSERRLYEQAALYNELDDKPLGFPFHRLAAHFEESDFNSYRFYNITIFHKKGSVDTSGDFSPHLY